MGHAAAETAARAVAGEMGWDEARVAREVADYRAFLERSFLLRPGRDAPVVQPRA